MRDQIKAIDPRRDQLGGETPMLCTPLVGRTRDAVLAEASNVIAQKPDIVEWRVDFFEAIADTSAVIATAEQLRKRAGTVPLIFTRRSSKEGGEAVRITEDEVVALYGKVAATRLFDFVDFEMSNDPDRVARVRSSTRANEVRLILSYHNFSYTPGVDFLVQRFMEAERLGGDVGKVAVMPRDRMDVLALLTATATADDKTHIPLISMSMGPLGSVTRMIGGLFGSRLSFAVGQAASAPGQIPIRDLVTVYDIIRRARGGEML